MRVGFEKGGLLFVILIMAQVGDSFQNVYIQPQVTGEGGELFLYFISSWEPPGSAASITIYYLFVLPE